MKHLVLFLAVSIFLFSCKSEKKTEHIKTSSKTETISDAWVYLFDGTSLDGWRAYNGDALPPGWIIKDSVLTFDTKLGLEQNYKGGKDIIYANEEFDNFELHVEWKLPKGGNSGIFYHVKEGHKSIPEIAPEYQLIDDLGYAQIHDLTAYNKSLGYTENPEELKPLQKTGSDYAMHPADQSQKVLNPIGEWNISKIIFTPEKVEHWLNGKKLLSFVPWDEAWEEKKNSDKWKNSPNYGIYKTGYIGLQDHASPIWFRNIKIKKL